MGSLGDSIPRQVTQYVRQNYVPLSLPSSIMSMPLDSVISSSSGASSSRRIEEDASDRRDLLKRREWCFSSVAGEKSDVVASGKEKSIWSVTVKNSVSLHHQLSNDSENSLSLHHQLSNDQPSLFFACPLSKILLYISFFNFIYKSYPE